MSNNFPPNQPPQFPTGGQPPHPGMPPAGPHSGGPHQGMPPQPSQPPRGMQPGQPQPGQPQPGAPRPARPAPGGRGVQRAAASGLAGKIVEAYGLGHSDRPVNRGLQGAMALGTATVLAFVMVGVDWASGGKVIPGGIADSSSGNGGVFAQGSSGGASNGGLQVLPGATVTQGAPGPGQVVAPTDGALPEDDESDAGDDAAVGATGDTAWDFVAANIMNTGTTDFAQYKGKPVVIYGFQDGCSGCEAEGPNLRGRIDKFNAAFAGKAVFIIAASNPPKMREMLQPYVTKNNLTKDVAVLGLDDPKFKMDAFPNLGGIDKDGKIVTLKQGEEIDWVKKTWGL